MASIIVSADVLRSLAFGSISGTYTAIGPAFDHPMRIVKVSNKTNTDMIISFDGVNDHDYITAGTSEEYDVAANQVGNAGWFFRVGTTVYVKQVLAPGSGAVYVTALYGKGE